MSGTSIGLDAALSTYVQRVGTREHGILGELRERTAALHGEWAIMQIAPEQGQLMALLAQLIGCRRYLEIGTFTGYSALVMALAMPNDGQIVCCDVSEDYTALAREYWQKAGVAHKVTLRIAPALETLHDLLAEGHAQQFDIAFIDADKSNYDGYYERCLELIRPNGLILIDNVLWSGYVADEMKTDATTQKLRALNAKIAADDRVDVSMVPIADGLTLARKR